jgi:hypothetical protein
LILPQGQCNIQAHDVGVSDGRTTCPFFELLQRVYKDQFELLISDYDIEVLSVPVGRGNSRVILDSRANPLQLIMPPFVFSIIRPVTPYYYPVNWLLRVLNQRSAIEEAVQKFHDQSNDIRKIHIVCTECQDLVSAHQNLQIMQYDLLSKPHGSMDIVRAMNLLNPSYFAPPQMKIAIDNLRESLVDGGLLITGSNTGAGTQINGGIYRRTGDSFETLYESGKGSPVTDMLVHACKAA